MATIVHPTPITESQPAYAELAKLLTPQTKAAIQPFLFISFSLDKKGKHETLTCFYVDPPKTFRLHQRSLSRKLASIRI
jgi:hypothetical protein